MRMTANLGKRKRQKIKTKKMRWILEQQAGLFSAIHYAIPQHEEKNMCVVTSQKQIQEHIIII